jgi:hypothetical protein
METYLDDTGYNLLMVPVTSIQKWDTWILRGILNFESWYFSWILRKKYKFQTLIILSFKTFNPLIFE